MKTKVLLVLLVLLLLVSCNAYKVDDGTLRDTLFSVEETRNGYWRIWMTHDDIAGYCTANAELGKKALSLLQEHSGEVVVSFRSINAEDPEYAWWDRSDCGSIQDGTGASTHMFLFDSIEPAPGRN